MKTSYQKKTKNKKKELLKGNVRLTTSIREVVHNVVYKCGTPSIFHCLKPTKYLPCLKNCFRKKLLFKAHEKNYCKKESLFKAHEMQALLKAHESLFFFKT